MPLTQKYSQNFETKVTCLLSIKMAAHSEIRTEAPIPRHVAHHHHDKSLKERQLEASQQWETISLKTAQNYVTYFKKWKFYWKNTDVNNEEPDGLGFYYQSPNGDPLEQNERKWWEYGVIINERTCEEYMHYIQIKVRGCLPFMSPFLSPFL